MRDHIDLYGLYYQTFNEIGINFLKEDKESYNDVCSDCTRLSNMINTVESAQSQNLDIFRKTLNDIIPKQNALIKDLTDEVDAEEFLNNNIGMYDILRKLDELEERFKALEKDSVKYNNYQEVP